jgi:hypothetical protein
MDQMSLASTPLRTRWTIPLKEQDLQIFYVLVVFNVKTAADSAHLLSAT